MLETGTKKKIKCARDFSTGTCGHRPQHCRRLADNDGLRTFMDIPTRPLLRMRKKLRNRQEECIRIFPHSNLSNFQPLVVVPMPASAPKTHI